MLKKREKRYREQGGQEEAIQVQASMGTANESSEQAGSTAVSGELTRDSAYLDKKLARSRTLIS